MRLKKDKKWIQGIELLCLAVLLLFIPGFFQEKDFQVTFIDVGQGDCILVSCQENYMLIDGGGSPHNVTGIGENVVVPYLKSLGIGYLDCVMNSHPDADHIGGLFPVLDQMEVGEVWTFPNYGDIHLNQQFLTLANNRGIPVKFAVSGMVYNLTPECSVTVVAPKQSEDFDDGSANEGSLVVRITYQDFDILATGDLEGKEQMALVTDPDKQALGKFDEIEVLKIPHHGSKNSYDEDWYAAFQPEAVVISVGKDNSYGHPDSGVVSYWQKRGAKVFRTDMDGSIKITTDGKQGFYETVE